MNDKKVLKWARYGAMFSLHDYYGDVARDDVRPQPMQFPKRSQKKARLLRRQVNGGKRPRR